MSETSRGDETTGSGKTNSSADDSHRTTRRACNDEPPAALPPDGSSKEQTIEMARQAARRIESSAKQQQANASVADQKFDSTSSIEIPDYELLHPIGRGAFGTVWLALNRHDGQFVAIKMIERNSDIELDGVRAMKGQFAENPFLVPIGHVGQVTDRDVGYYYYVMPLADDAIGPSSLQYEPLTLRLHIDRMVRVPVDEAIGICRSILRGLEILHASGGVHRDVKPDNILRFDGVWKLGDSGFVRSSDQNDEMNCGTPGFSPSDGSNSPSADLFAVGKTMFLMLTGNELTANGVDLTNLEGDPAVLRQVERVVLQACHEDVGNRFTTARQMLDALPELKAQNRTLTISTWRGWHSIALAVLVCGLFMWSVPRLGNLMSNEKGDVRPAAKVSAKIDSMTLRHYIRQGDKEQESVLGPVTVVAHLGDSVSINAELRDPAYCYLIACDPDGTTKLISGDPLVPPSLQESLVVPENRSADNAHQVYQLTGTPGIQAFILVVSSTPLPTYEKWASMVGFDIWQREKLDTNELSSENAWQIRNGQVIVHAIRDRGQVASLRRYPEFLNTLRSFFLDIDDIDAFEIWVFRVDER